MTEEIKTCGKVGCSPELLQAGCCDGEYQVKCWCGKEIEIGPVSKIAVVGVWNNQIEAQKVKK